MSKENSCFSACLSIIQSRIMSVYPSVCPSVRLSLKISATAEPNGLYSLGNVDSSPAKTKYLKIFGRPSFPCRDKAPKKTRGKKTLD